MTTIKPSDWQLSRDPKVFRWRGSRPEFMPKDEVLKRLNASASEIEARVLLSKADEYFKRARKEKLAGPEALLEQLAYELRDEAAAARGGK